MNVTTEDGRDIDFSGYCKMTVRPAGKSVWEFIATHRNGSELNIATFTSPEDAKSASISLCQAANAGKS